MKRSLIFLLTYLLLISCSKTESYLTILNEDSIIIHAAGETVVLEGKQSFSFAQLIEVIDEEQIFVDLLPGMEFSIKGEWYDLLIEDKKMSIEITENTSGKKRSLLVTVNHMNVFNHLSVLQNE